MARAIVQNDRERPVHGKACTNSTGESFRETANVFADPRSRGLCRQATTL
jgi:hypothetical protein